MNDISGATSSDEHDRAELYYAGIRKMKKEEMLRKIKPGYEPNLQMEDVLLKISLVSKFRFAYVAVCAASLFVFIGMVGSSSFTIEADDNRSWLS